MNTLNYLVAQLLRKNKIPFDKEELSFQIQSHPSYPSLHAVTGVLDHFNIENLAADVPVNVEVLLQLPDSFIAQVNTDTGKDLVVVQRVKLDYNIIYSSKKTEKVTEAAFLSIFTGILVAIEKPENEERFSNHKSWIKQTAFSITSILLVSLLFLNTTPIITLGYLAFTIIGLLMSIAIVKQEQGIETSIGNAFCAGASEKKDCDAVLSSKGANLFGDYKLSDVSLLYFSGLLIAVLISILFKSTLVTALYTISVISLPITLYSIYYQYAVVKKWCFLCLSIVAVLWLQAGLVFIDGNYLTPITLETSLLIAFSFTLFFTIWSFLKPIISANVLLKKDKIEFVKFKRNFNLFESLLSKSATLHTAIPNTHEVVFGNKNAVLELVIVTNPFCGHCKPVHQLVHDVLKKYKEQVKIIIRFSVNTKDTENSAVKVTSRILEIYQTKGEKVSLEAMDDIYSGMTSETWLEKWENCEEKENQLEILKSQSAWCTENAINFTPEILINGKSFPKEYDRQDLLFFIEELEENCCVANSEIMRTT